MGISSSWVCKILLHCITTFSLNFCSPLVVCCVYVGCFIISVLKLCTFFYVGSSLWCNMWLGIFLTSSSLYIFFLHDHFNHIYFRYMNMLLILSCSVISWHSISLSSCVDGSWSIWSESLISVSWWSLVCSFGCCCSSLVLCNYCNIVVLCIDVFFLLCNIAAHSCDVALFQIVLCQYLWR